MKSQCPRCHGYKTSSQRAQAFYLSCGMVLTGALLFFLVYPLILCPLGMLVMVLSAIVPSNKMSCQDCKNVFIRE